MRNDILTPAGKLASRARELEISAEAMRAKNTAKIEQRKTQLIDRIDG